MSSMDEAQAVESPSEMNNNVRDLDEGGEYWQDHQPSTEVSSLEDLIQKLHREFEKDEIDVDYVHEIMRSYRSNPQDWRRFAKFDRFRYTRNLVDAGNDKFNLMVLCWGEGHGSAIHDHADAHCFMKMLDGTLEEIRFAWPQMGEEGRSLRVIGQTEIRTNDVCYINDSMGLHRVENPSHVNSAVSLHLYCPPFGSCSVFNQKDGQRSKANVTFYSKFGERRDKVSYGGKRPEDN